ncbi:hypothetical protein NP493_114g05057 [Ridgeia piscesae]|uniref:Uncharacterized protein n=1 Tax=Ridgeia piscesae TaxID=27915 RepID=A0AAD9P6Q0_RIDPI|nr:hypothetical protein NP493_114g05057 [Ridgeia piscesae]
MKAAWSFPSSSTGVGAINTMLPFKPSFSNRPFISRTATAMAYSFCIALLEPRWNSTVTMPSCCSTDSSLSSTTWSPFGGIPSFTLMTVTPAYTKSSFFSVCTKSLTGTAPSVPITDTRISCRSPILTTGVGATNNRRPSGDTTAG